MEPINEERVSPWLADNIKGSEPPFTYSLVASGQSNLTFFVSDAKQNRWVLRRPPMHQILATAHDMVREYTIISALHPTGFLVPAPVALCEDESINTFSFYVMEFIDGLIITDMEAAKKTSLELRGKSGPALAQTLAHLHSLDPTKVGLGELAKTEDYIARQLRRWLKQFKQSKAPQSEDVEKIHDILKENTPEQKYSGIVHADYRLDNCVLDENTGEIRAVLDWELCTLGDTMADIGIFAAYWAESTNDETVLFGSPTALPGFINRQELLDEYAKATNRDLEHIDYYLAFAHWRLICIIQGVYSRYLDGAMHGKTPPGGVEDLRLRIEALIKRTWVHVEKI